MGKIFDHNEIDKTNGNLIKKIEVCPTIQGKPLTFLYLK